MRAQGVSSAVMRDTTVSFLNVMYVTLFHKGDNLAFLKEIEIFDLLNCCSDNTCMDNRVFYFFFRFNYINNY